MQKISKITLIFSTLLLAACSKAVPLQEINKEPLYSSYQQAESYSRVQHAITKAGESLGWQMKYVRRGLIIAVHDEGERSIVSSVKYNRHIYSIHYVRSKGYAHEGKYISSEYNMMIDKLNAAIKKELLRDTDTHSPMKAPI